MMNFRGFAVNGEFYVFAVKFSDFVMKDYNFAVNLL